MKLSDSQKSWLEKHARRYHEQTTPAVASYLADRGIDQDAAASYLLGLVVDPDPMHEPFRGRLSIPFLTPTGVVYMRFRCLEELTDPSHSCKEAGHGKYEGQKGLETHLYNVQALHDADTEVGISEGEVDALVATINGLPTVGVPGANNWKHFYARLFDDFARVPILGDGDKAGREFTGKLAQVIDGGEAKLMPEGYDINSFILENGSEKFLEYVHS